MKTSRSLVLTLATGFSVVFARKDTMCQITSG